MYSVKVLESKKFGKMLKNKKLKNIQNYRYEPNLNTVLFDYININNSTNSIPISYKTYTYNEDEISFMINDLSSYTPNFVYTYSKDYVDLWQESVDGMLLNIWIQDKSYEDINSVLQQIFISYSLLYDFLDFIPYRSDNIYIVDLNETRQIVYQDLSGNYFSIVSKYLVKINNYDMLFRSDGFMSQRLSKYLKKFGYYDFVLTEKGKKNTLSNSIKQILKLTNEYKQYSQNNTIYNFYDANSIINYQLDITQDRYVSRKEIMRDCIVSIKEIEIEIDDMNQSIRDYKRFIKNYINIGSV